MNRKTSLIAVTGGKGGVGKSTLAVNLSLSFSIKGYKVLLVDADVDGPNVVNLMGGKFSNPEVVYSFIPKVDENRCSKCGECSKVCEDHALVQVGDRYPFLFIELCSGCTACRLVCPANAILEGKKEVGYIYRNKLSGIKVITGMLKPGEPRSQLVVKEVKEKALNMGRKEGIDLIIIDTAPGANITVARALMDVDFVVAVTEPSLLALHDLKSILKLVNELNLPSGVVINKSDLLPELKDAIVSFCRKNGIQLIGEIPFDEEVLNSVVKCKPIVKYNPESKAFKKYMEIAEEIEELLSLKKLDI